MKVCASCGTSACWRGVLMCEDARTAGVAEGHSRGACSCSGRPLPPLRCPQCGGRIISAVLERTASFSYSEHRDAVGFECDNTRCLAEWDIEGNPRGDA